MENAKAPFRLEDSPVEIDLDDIKKVDSKKLISRDFRKIEIEFWSAADNLDVEVRPGEFTVLARMVRINMEKFGEPGVHERDSMFFVKPKSVPLELQKVEIDDLYKYVIEQMARPDPTSGWGWRMVDKGV